MIFQVLFQWVLLQTCDEGGHPPANQVVESHRAVVDVSHFADHAVEVKALQEEPGEGAQVEEVQQDGDDRAHKLQPEGHRDGEGEEKEEAVVERRRGAREQGGYRVVGLVDAQDEDQLGEEERSRSVVDDAGLVALQGSQAEQEDGGEEQEAKRHSHRAPRQHLDGQNLSVLHGGQNHSQSALQQRYGNLGGNLLQ